MMKTLSVEIQLADYDGAASLISNWAHNNESRYVCIANVHMLMEAYDSASYSDVINNADLVVSDGMPLVWVMRLKGQRDQKRVYGPTLMLKVIETTCGHEIPVGFYGGKPEVLELLGARLQARYPGLDVAYSYSPPFRDLSLVEDEAVVQQVNNSGVRILFVGLGCPKQELWMAEHHGRIKAVMIGVGAAFDFHAGVKPQAPHFMQNVGLEWLFRLLSEPRRLWRRYLYHNPRFILLAVMDLLKFPRKMAGR